MKRKDFRSEIIPITIENTDEFQNMGNKNLNTTDLIYLASYDELYDDEENYVERTISAVDYAQMNNAYVSNDDITDTGKKATRAWLRSGYMECAVYVVNGDGEWGFEFTDNRTVGLCPALHYKLPSRGKRKEFDIREVKDTKGETIYHTLQIGEYPKTKVDESLSETLELLYNKGKIKEGLSCTGRWYSGNGQQQVSKDYAGKHSPEFEYKGNRYVRVISYPSNYENRYSDGTINGEIGTVRWVKVEPISFVIHNWDEMPKTINPRGTGQAKYFDLRAEEVIIANIPFYPDDNNKDSSMWQYSYVRGFLNGIDVRKTVQKSDTEDATIRGGDFTGECNFLNEAFNLSRNPMIVYKIPDSETEIPNDAFNGCVSLKKIIMHSGIENIGKRAFDGLDFKYAYRTVTGELIFVQELPENKEKYTEAIELRKLLKHMVGFDYSILVQGGKKLEEIVYLADTLSKHRFSIPYVYGLALTDSGQTETFCQNSVFKFFKNEIPNIADILLDFPEEERLDFFKFATSLGCFSTDRILNNGKETGVILAQKASSLLARLLKTDEMRLR